MLNYLPVGIIKVNNDYIMHSRKWRNSVDPEVTNPIYVPTYDGKTHLQLEIYTWTELPV